MDGGNAQIPLIHCRVRESVISDPLLPFPVGQGTGGERRDFFNDIRQERSSPGKFRTPVSRTKL